MIYNKPRDFSWKVLPSPSSLFRRKKEKELNTTDKLISKNTTVETYAPPKKNVDIILDGKPTFVKNLEVDENTIIDLTAMPVIDGIPILQFPDEPYKETVKDSTLTVFTETTEDKNTVEENKEKVNEKKTSGNRVNKLKIASFFVMLYFGAVISFYMPLRPAYSETEKRDLKQFPKFSWSSLQSGDFFDNITTWFSDTFPFRDQLTKLDSKIEEFYGFGTVVIHGEIESGDEIPDAPMDTPPEDNNPSDTTEQNTPPTVTEPVTMPTEDELNNNGNTNAPVPDIPTQSLGAIIVAGDSAYEYYSFSNTLAPRFINSVNAINEKAKPTDNVYSLIIPTSIDITLNDAIRADVASSNQKKALEYFNGSTKNAVAINTIYNTLRAHRSEYIYFRTDHHWTALGAYYTYVDFCNFKGITPVPLSDYNTTVYYNFTGTFYTSAGQSSTLEANADNVVTYTPFNNTECVITNSNGSQYKWDIVTDVNEYGSTLKYLTFIGGDNPLTTIKNNDNTSGQTCLVIKDSYGNAFVPFLVPHYSTIYVIDPRHYNGTLESFAEDKTINDVVFVSNISTTRNEIFIKSMENLVD